MRETLDFAKLQGMGNDFLVTIVENVDAVVRPDSLALRLCERRLGAGADGLVFADSRSRPHCDFRSRIFNADGGEAEVSGNGTRCLAAYLHYTGLWTNQDIRIGTVAGVKHGRLLGRSGSRFDFEFDMGEPILDSIDIPVALDPPRNPVVAHHLRIDDQDLEITCTSMGNPHCTLFCAGIEPEMVQKLGPAISRHSMFPNSTNVEFVRRISSTEIEVRFWERGVGETQASGTGSCGAAVASALNGFTGREVTVRTLGGDLKVRWDQTNTVFLTGSAAMIYQARWLGGLPPSEADLNL